MDLADSVQEVMQYTSIDGLQVELELEEAATTGDPRLVERLVANLLDNARYHNVEQGWISVWTGMRAGRPTLLVCNSGPKIDPARVGQLIEPFRRLNGDRPSPTHGLGLGLSIVSAIASAHGAELSATPRAKGGLDVEVRFPVAARPLAALH
jgi:signal transduction histidine kinase